MRVSIHGIYRILLPSPRFNNAVSFPSFTSRGSLIAPNAVLSAAHCGDYTGYDVIVGAWKLDDDTTVGATTVRVVEWIEHPDYDYWSLRNDFALLRLQNEVTFDTDIQLSINDSKNINNGEDLDVLGLGVTQEGGEKSSVLNDVQVKAIKTKKCNERKWHDDKIDDATMFCAGE
jgi:secreted trypsin-like serine protease